MRGRVEAESTLANSMTDLMTSLAVVFILLLVVYLNHAWLENKIREKRYRDAIAGTKTVKRDLKLELGTRGIQSEDDLRDPLAIVIYLKNDKLQFDHDKSDLKPAGKEFIKAFIPKLASVLAGDRFFSDLESVLIEGHTDSDGDDEHNLRLSQDRSYAVLRCTLNECSLTGLARERLLDLVSTNGRGERDLLPPGATPGHEDKPESRRVVFKIRVKSIEQKNIILI